MKIAKIPKVLSPNSVLNILKASKRRLTRQVLQRFDHAKEVSKPVFLVGNGRSGTSMIVRQLARSWQVDLYNEDHPAAFDDWQLRDDAVIKSIIENSYARVVLFKPIKDTYRTDALLRNFPTSKVLFPFRHFDDVINSAENKFYDENGLVIKPIGDQLFDRRSPIVRWIHTDFEELKKSPPPLMTKQMILSLWSPDLDLESNIALHWLFVNRLYFDLKLDQSERVKLLHYESIAKKPEEHFPEICRFLGLSFKDKLIEGVFSTSIGREPPPEIDPMIRDACESLWRQLCRQVREQ